jgi:acyl transferase domain-containing protein/surfactin synthase thioesterase subunit
MSDFDIAVIGMACRVPGAHDVKSFWENLRLGRESITLFRDDEIDPGSRWLLSNPEFVKAGAILEDIDLFDAAFFKMSAREAELTDPQQRMFLECTVTALEDAGYGDFDRSSLTSIYAGSWMSSYARRTAAQLKSPADEFQALLGSGLDYLTTRVSYKLNLKGESVAVQTACSTSLVAVHFACQSLLNGQSDMAIAGGVSVDAKLKAGYLHQEGMVYSRDGHCRPFDHLAQGTIRGHGLGVVVLKRYDDAVHDRDHVYAIIKGTAINNDGYDKIGFAAPSVDGQAAAIRSALAMANVATSTIGYVEAHGTATPLGDPIEVQALTQAFDSEQHGYCVLGSVKSNFGHLVEAAGVAGLIKAVLAIHHGEIPPTLHYAKPNPHIDFSRTPFIVNNDLRRFPALNGRRRAGVSAFGIGGTNAHLVLEEAPPRTATHSAPPYAILLSAEAPAALDALRVDLLQHMKTHEETDLGDVAFTLAVGRRALRHRWACVVQDRSELMAALERGPEFNAGRNPLSSDLETAVAAWLDGKAIDWSEYFKTMACGRVALPTYPFQRGRYWLEENPAAPALFQGGLPWLGSETGERAATSAEEDGGAKLLLVSSDSEDALRARAQALGSAAAETSGTMGDFCIGANVVASHGPHRLAIAFQSRDELLDRLDAFLSGSAPRENVFVGTACSRRLGFVFSGQGAQWWGMGQELMSEPLFKTAIEECDQLLSELGSGVALIRQFSASESTSAINRPEIALPSLVGLQIGLTRLLARAGITPDAIIGHSAGEVAAAHVAGALSLKDALAVAWHRGRLMQRVAGRGRTALVRLSLDEARRAMSGYESSVWIAGTNSPAHTILSGRPEALDALLEKLTAKGISAHALRVDVAFHSPMMDELLPELAASLESVQLGAATVPFYSSVLGIRCDGPELDVAYWLRNLREPFIFGRTLACMVDAGITHFVEVSPHPVLGEAVAEVLRSTGREGEFSGVLARGEDERLAFTKALAALHIAGRAPKWPVFARTANAPLPTPKSRARYSAQAGASILEVLRELVADSVRVAPSNLDVTRPLVEFGLDSLSGLSLLRQIQDAFGVRLAAKDLLSIGTVAKLADHIESPVSDQRKSTEDVGPGRALLPLRTREGSTATLCCFPGAGGTAMMMVPWGAVADGFDVLAYDPPGRGGDRRPLHRTIKDIVGRCASELQAQRGPIVCLGYSMGGILAFAVARELEQAGLEVHGVVISHTLAPHRWGENKGRTRQELETIFAHEFDKFAADQLSRQESLSAVMADIEVALSYGIPEGTQLQCPVHLLTSKDDVLQPHDAVAEWDRYCRNSTLHHGKGGHFDFIDHPENRILLQSTLSELRSRTA